MIAPRISLVTLGVRDMSRMRAFYDNLGWAATPDSDDSHAMYKTAGAVLMLFPHTSLASDATIDPKTPVEGFRGTSTAINLGSREEVDAAFDHLRSIDAKIAKEPEAVFWGGYSGYFQDPEGNLWEIAHNPGFSFDERGAVIFSD